MFGIGEPLMRVNAVTQAVFDACNGSNADEDTLIALTNVPAVNVNATAELKSTMLHAAAQGGRVEWARVLLALGARIDPRNTVDETPLHMAATNLNLSMMELLLEAGADQHLVDWRGKSVRLCVEKAKTGDRLKARKAMLLLDRFGSGQEREVEAKRLRERGNKAYKSGNPEAALKYYAQANEVMPHAFTFGNEALVHISRGDWYSAAIAATKATEADPSYGRGWHRLVKAHLNARNFPLALTAVKAALNALAADDTEVPRLRAIEGLLQGCGVRPRRLSADGERVDPVRNEVKARLNRGVPSAPCAYCRVPLPRPLEQYEGCAWCGCDPTGNLAAGLTDAVIAAIL